MTRPETCGSAGGAVSFWVKLVVADCNGINGIISSLQPFISCSLCTQKLHPLINNSFIDKYHLSQHLSFKTWL